MWKLNYIIIILIIWYYYLNDIVRNIRSPGKLMKKDELVEISGGQLVVADVSTSSATIIKKNDARDVAMASGLQSIG